MSRAPLRRAAGLAAAALAAACAHVEPPTGGPEDKAPPELLVTRPDSLVVRADWRGPVVLVFDERISERGAREAVSVSPRTSPVVVEHDGDELRVSLREGWQPGVVYHVNVVPPLQDLFNNVRREPTRLVFSTGPEIPDTRLAGTVLDPTTGKPEVAALVDAVRRADSLTYRVQTDSSGAFELSRIPAGDYLVRAYRDLNRSRALDAFEPRDTSDVSLAVGTPAQARLRVLQPDSTPAEIASVEAAAGTVTVQFDDFLDPLQSIAPGRVQIMSRTGRFAPVNQVRIGTPPAGEGADDTVRARPPRADTAAAEPLPSRTMVLKLSSDAELRPGEEYDVTITRVRNLNGLVADARGRLTIPGAPEQTPVPPAAAPDTAANALRAPRRPRTVSDHD